jgi:hypothetical protein
VDEINEINLDEINFDKNNKYNYKKYKIIYIFNRIKNKLNKFINKINHIKLYITIFKYTYT